MPEKEYTSDDVFQELLASSAAASRTIITRKQPEEVPANPFGKSRIRISK